MKHYDINFVDGTVETVEANIEELPSDREGWWLVTHLHLDAETQTKLVHHGRIYVNMRNVTFIKET